jgi:hypothetical protein
VGVPKIASVRAGGEVSRTKIFTKKEERDMKSSKIKEAVKKAETQLSAYHNERVKLEERLDMLTDKCHGIIAKCEFDISEMKRLLCEAELLEKYS